MALVRSFSRKEFSPRKLHQEVDAKYGRFESDGRVVVQIETYVKSDRVSYGEPSQIIQIDLVGAEALLAIIKREFNLS